MRNLQSIKENKKIFFLITFNVVKTNKHYSLYIIILTDSNEKHCVDVRK